MGRPPGRLNDDHDDKRHRMAAAIALDLLDAQGEPRTFKDLASVAGVSPSTLRHYFTDLDGAYEAALAASLTEGSFALAYLSEPHGDSPRAALRTFVEGLVEGWSRGVGARFTGALTLATGHPERGPLFVNRVLEPSLQAAETLLDALVERGWLPAGDARQRALLLVSPILMALLHQHELGGASCRPLDMGPFVDRHLDAVLAGLKASSGTSSSRT